MLLPAGGCVNQNSWHDANPSAGAKCQAGKALRVIVVSSTLLVSISA